MPCYDSRSAPENVRRETRAESRDKINRLTRVACDMAAAMKQRGGVFTLQPETIEWIKQHEEWDAKRKAGK